MENVNRPDTKGDSQKEAAQAQPKSVNKVYFHCIFAQFCSVSISNRIILTA